MDNMRFYHVKYKNMKIVLGFSNYSFKYYTQYIDGGIMLIVNNNLKPKDKSKLLHQAIKKNGKK